MDFSTFIDGTYSILILVLACSGFWAFVQNERNIHSKKKGEKSNQDRLLIGLAHDRIMFLGMNYVERGYITHDEYENLNVYLYEPYDAMGGNGSAKRVMEEVQKLPLYKPIYLVKEEKEQTDDSGQQDL